MYTMRGGGVLSLLGRCEKIWRDFLTCIPSFYISLLTYLMILTHIMEWGYCDIGLKGREAKKL